MQNKLASRNRSDFLGLLYFYIQAKLKDEGTIADMQLLLAFFLVAYL